MSPSSFLRRRVHLAVSRRYVRTSSSDARDMAGSYAMRETLVIRHFTQEPHWDAYSGKVGVRPRFFFPLYVPPIQLRRNPGLRYGGVKQLHRYGIQPGLSRYRSRMVSGSVLLRHITATGMPHSARMALNRTNVSSRPVNLSASCASANPSLITQPAPNSYASGTRMPVRKISRERMTSNPSLGELFRSMTSR